MIFMKCFINWILLFVSNRTPERSSYLFSSPNTTCLVYINSKYIPITHCIRRIIQKIMAMLSWAEATNPWVCIVHNHWSLSNWCCQLLSNVSFPFNHHKQAFAFTTNPAADMDVLEVVELLTKSTQTSFETTLTLYDQITQNTYHFFVPMYFKK